MENFTLCLSGFLGAPSDWKFLQAADDKPFFNPSLVADWAPLPKESWTEWNRRVLTLIQQKAQAHPIRAIGYSLGARLLAQIACEYPGIFHELHLVSWNPCFLTASEKSERIALDSDWAKKLLYMDWESFLAAWNDLPVFQGTSPLERSEPSQEEKIIWARVLQTFSLGFQENQLSSLLALCSSFQVFIGKQDEKLSALFAGYFQESWLTLLPGGHRLLLDCPDIIREV